MRQRELVNEERKSIEVKPSNAQEKHFLQNLEVGLQTIQFMAKAVKAIEALTEIGELKEQGKDIAQKKLGAGREGTVYFETGNTFINVVVKKVSYWGELQKSEKVVELVDTVLETVKKSLEAGMKPAEAISVVRDYLMAVESEKMSASISPKFKNEIEPSAEAMQLFRNEIEKELPTSI